MNRWLSLTVATWLLVVVSGATAEEITWDNVTAPAPNAADEPLAGSFSLAAATRFLDQASLEWTKSRKCFTCHTNYVYLLARPALVANGGDHEAHRRVRAALEELVEQRWVESGPRWDAEVVMSAAVLALHDAATTGKLHPTTRKALDRMWTVQREDGGVSWLKCNWPPMESDDEYGATMMALAAGAAPEGYRQTEAAQQGLQRLRQYLTGRPAPSLHHEAMLLWADSYLGDLFTAEQRTAVQQKLLGLQREDGGWNSATLGDWKRADGQAQELTHSDGYGTGFVMYVLHRGGVAANDPRLQRGAAWLKANQRASGRWYSRSLNKDNKHFLSHAGSAFAALALATCQSPSSAE